MFEISRLGAIGVFQNKNDGSDVLSKCNTIISNYKNSFKSFSLPSIVFLSEISKNSNLVHLHPSQIGEPGYSMGLNLKRTH